MSDRLTGLGLAIGIVGNGLLCVCSVVVFVVNVSSEKYGLALGSLILFAACSVQLHHFMDHKHD